MFYSSGKWFAGWQAMY